MLRSLASLSIALPVVVLVLTLHGIRAAPSKRLASATVLAMGAGLDPLSTSNSVAISWLARMTLASDTVGLLRMLSNWVLLSPGSHCLFRFARLRSFGFNGALRKISPTVSENLAGPLRQKPSGAHWV